MKRLGMRLIACLFLTVFLAACAHDNSAQGPSNEERARAKENLGVSLIREGDYQAGLKELLQASELDPGNAGIHNAIGLAYRNLKEFGKAVAHFQRALALKPGLSEARNNLGTVYLIRRRWDSAIACFQKAAEDIMYTTRHYAYENLGTAYFMKGDYEKAVESYKASLEIDPTYGPAWVNLGLTYEALKRWQPALEAYKKSLEGDPNAPKPYLLMGRLYLKLNRNQEAAEALTKAIENDLTGTYAKEARSLLKRAREGG